jgi:hypothetical protein
VSSANAIIHSYLRLDFLGPPARCLTKSPRWYEDPTLFIRLNGTTQAPPLPITLRSDWCGCGNQAVVPDHSSR